MLRKRKFKRLWGCLMVLALVLSSIAWPEVQRARAAGTGTEPEGSWTESTISTTSYVSTDMFEEGNKGYLFQMMKSDLTGSYLKITYTVDDASLFESDTEVFNFQPYDTTVYSGWNNNIVTFGDCSEANGVYTSYYSIDSIVSSYTGTYTVDAVNISMMTSELTYTLTGVYMLTEVDEEAEADAAAEEDVLIYEEDGTTISHETIQEFSLEDLQAVNSDITLTNCSKKTVQVYIHVTASSPYSYLKLRVGNLTDSNFSNVELIGNKSTKYSSSNSPHYLHLGYRTSGGYGSGMGVNETGNYVFASKSLSKNDGTDAGTGVRLTRRTSDVEAYIIGIVIGDYSVSVSAPDENGDVTLTDGFDADAANVESWELDDSDYTDEELAEMNAEALAAAYSGLESAIEGCEALDEDYYEAASWTELQEAIVTAKAVLETVKAYTSVTDDMEQTCRDARDALENVRTAMIPKASTDTGNPKSFRLLSKSEVIDEMGAGINLGNTMDGHTGLTPSETSWQAYKTTKDYIKALHDAGYNTVRVPVTWGTMINDDYSINTAWMARVQEIVDYCVDQDMYCIINIHHDGAANHDARGDNTPMCWLDTAADDIEAVYAKFEGVWKSIAENFKDYDEHLIFESMNEVTDDHNSGLENEDTQILNNLNQLFVNTVRATGSNNTKRWLAITGRFATFSTGTTLPTDSLVDSEAETTRMMFSVHIYKNNSATSWSYDNLKTWQSSLSSTVKNVQNNLSSDMPIYVGEYGVRTQEQSGSSTGYNNAERALNYEFCAATADFYGCVPIVWDQGSSDYTDIQTQTGLFTDWDRPNLSPVYDDVVEGTIRGSYLDYSSELSTRLSDIYTSYGHEDTSNTDVSTDPEIAEITALSISGDSYSDNTLKLTAGERVTLSAEASPSDTNDVVLWSTDDDSIVTVSKGLVHAKKAGVATIYAYSQSKSVTETIQVVVSPDENAQTADSIEVGQAYYTVERGETTDIKSVTLSPADSTDEITYTSSDSSIAAVSSSGIITGVNAGETYIIISASGGASTIVKVKVTDSKASTLSVALHAYWNDGDEEGDVIDITEDGQYTVSFDVEKDLVSTSHTDLNNVVSIYIKDENAENPSVETAQIRYDKVVVNDTEELTITSTDFKSAIKDNGQFDTNDPINAWDGSAVSEVSASNHEITFTSVSNPTKIEVTFTIQDLTFAKTSEKENEATEMTTSDSSIIKLSEVADTASLHLTLTPADTDSGVTVYSTNTSVVSADKQYYTVDEDGNITITLTAVSEGTATVTAITENDLRVFWAVGVGDVEVSEPTDPTPAGLNGNSEDDSSSTEAPEDTATPPASEVPGGTTEPSASPGADTGSTAAPSATAAPGSDAADGDDTSGTGQTLPKKGTTVKVSNANYLVTKSSATSGTVTYVASTKKKATSISVPKTVKINGYTFKVTAIQKNAFKGNKYLKKLTVGSNIKKIGANAFYNAKKLKTIKINSKVLTSVGSKAFKGTYKKASVTVPKAKYAKYKKLLKKAGLSSKAKYKKK